MITCPGSVIFVVMSLNSIQGFTMRLIFLSLACVGMLSGCTKSQPDGSMSITRPDNGTAVENSDDEKRSEQASQEAEKRKSLITAEIESLPKHPWAGSYYMGDGLGVNVLLELSPANGYLFEWRGCMGLYDRNYGSIEPQGKHLHLSFTFPNSRQGFQGIAEKLLPVHWGGRTYLVPSDDVVGFCNDVNSGDEPRNSLRGNYLLRNGDEKKVVTGHPKLPPKFVPYLLDRPIEATIKEIGSDTIRPSICDWNFIDTEVVIDVGSSDGILPGMELYVLTLDSLVPSMKVQSVEESKSTGVITSTDDSPAKIETGLKFSTRPRWNK